MGFILDSVGRVSIEAKRTSFVITREAPWHGDEYDSLEIANEDFQDLLQALLALARYEQWTTLTALKQGNDHA